MEGVGTSNSAKRILSFCGFLLMNLSAVLLLYLDPQKFNFFPRCLFHEITGFACPGCGLTRGFHALLNGNLSAALHYNALLPFYGIFLGGIYLHLFLIALKGRGLTLSSEKYIGFLIAFLVIGIIFGILRNLPFYPFTLLYPP